MSTAKYLRVKSENDRIFAEGEWAMKSRFIEDFQPVPLNRKDKFVLSDNIQHLTTVECILQNAGKRVIALNFANAHRAGGAYTLGGNAQEESLCRATLLYYTIRTVKKFYKNNAKHVGALYTDGMILSENVPVIRTEDGSRLKETVYADFVTSPAVNRHGVPPWQTIVANETMEHRIEKIVSLMQSEKPDVMILGAFGCGAFGNKREKVLPAFERAINKYTDGSAEIIFAIS